MGSGFLFQSRLSTVQQKLQGEHAWEQGKQGTGDAKSINEPSVNQGAINITSSTCTKVMWKESLRMFHTLPTWRAPKGKVWDASSPQLTHRTLQGGEKEECVLCSHWRLQKNTSYLVLAWAGRSKQVCLWARMEKHTSDVKFYVWASPLEPEEHSCL